MYHSIADDGWFFSVSPREFERQIAYLSKQYHAVTLTHIADFLEGKKSLLPRSVAVTFDDGYRNFLTDALPVLEKYHVPATLFVCAGTMDAHEVGNTLPVLSSDELRRVAGSGLVTIGSHAVTHRKLTRLNLDEVRNEVSSSRVLLAGQTGHAIDFFAYPKGSMNESVRHMVQAAGYRGAVSTIQRLAETRGSLYAIPRIQIDARTNFFEFRAKLTVVANWYEALWRLFR